MPVASASGGHFWEDQQLSNGRGVCMQTVVMVGYLMQDGLGWVGGWGWGGAGGGIQEVKRIRKWGGETDGEYSRVVEATWRRMEWILRGEVEGEWRLKEAWSFMVELWERDRGRKDMEKGTQSNPQTKISNHIKWRRKNREHEEHTLSF